MRVGGQFHSPATVGVPWGKGPGTHFTGDWVGFEASLDGYEKSRPQGLRLPEGPAHKGSLACTVDAIHIDYASRAVVVAFFTHW
jgi:hypothetical protein